MKKGLRVILSGGGTGGHIYPAIAIADEIRRRYPDAEILFVGAEDRMEMEKIPQAGYEIEGLWITGFQRSVSLKNLLFPAKLVSSLWKSKKILSRFKPDVVIGTGGFASGPLLQMAHVDNIPTLIQEQNFLPGVTNKLLARKAKVICTAFPGMEQHFPPEKTVLTGNPVRKDLIKVNDKRKEAFEYFNLNKDKKVMLVLGGSLGSRKINELIRDNIISLERHDLQVIWQTGSLYYEEFRKYSERTHVQTLAFVDRMDLAYAAADVIISRAGAGTVSELAIVGKPVFFIPSPNVAEDHQTKNAEAIAQQNAAVVIPEKELDQKFRKSFYPVVDSEQDLTRMGENINKMAKPNATAHIVDEVEKLIGKQN